MPPEESEQGHKGAAQPTETVAPASQPRPSGQRVASRSGRFFPAPGNEGRQ